jgi:glycine/D-amino acid oxidase-like deaminating enzyme
VTDLPRQADVSWWMEEALADPAFAEPEPCPPLDTDRDADVVILGGGYTGMWTAWFLLERDPSLEIVLLEAETCGSGPSGRNGGFCNGLWEELPLLVRALGDREAVRVGERSERSVDALGRWCAENDVDAWYTPKGHLGVATSDAQDGAWRDVVMHARRLGVERGRFVELDADEVRARCDGPAFGAGLLTPRAATLQPARLALGLRRALLARGVRIHEHAPVHRFSPGPPVRAEAPGGRVRAERGILATGVWASGVRPFRRTIVPRGSYIVVTAPAPGRLADLGWTGGEGIYDFRTALHYVRTTPDGRIALGVVGSAAGLGTGLGPRLRYDRSSVARAVADLHRLFPSFADVPLEAAWGGPIDVTGLHLPFFGTLPGGAVHYGLGYTGGGVGPCHLGGEVLSGLALGVEDEDGTLPLVGLRPKPFPPEPLRSVGTSLVQRAIVRRDDLRDAGRRPDPVTALLAGMPRRLGYELGP